jgi:hypothetical protein
MTAISVPAGWYATLADDGYALLPGVFSPGQADALLGRLESALAANDGGTLRAGGAVYGARNLLQRCPWLADAWRRAPLPGVLGEVLGHRFGLVRVLYFDKPPEQSWSLPWHKDFAIAVKDNRLPSVRFARPTTKAGVPPVEAPEELLERMLTLRLHLDEVTEENGPLRIIPGSHRAGKESGAGERPPVAILARPGDVLAMRPLVSHGSNRSLPGTRRHRRILHLEFAADPELPDGYAWHTFIPGPAG